MLFDFMFMDLYTYLVESKDKSYDKESLKSFKSLKGYRYFSDGFVQNVWIHKLPTGKYLYLHCHCFASLSIKKFYTVYVCMSRKGKPVVMFLLSCSSSKTSSVKGYQRYQKMSPAQEHCNSDMFHQKRCASSIGQRHLFS